MAKFHIEIDTDNAAFEGEILILELNRILTKGVINKLDSICQDQGHTTSLMDINGNRVGSVKLNWDHDND